MKIVLTILIVAVFLYTATLGGLYFFQRNLLYFPTKYFEHPFQEIQISNQGETTTTIVLNEGNDDALIYFGGNAETVAKNAEIFHAKYPNITVYLFNYRGYSGSTGKPSETANYADALVLHETIKSRHKQISVLGRSLGSGVATYLAAHRPIHKVILITPFDSVLNVAKRHFRLFPVGLLIKDKYDSAARAKQINSDVLVIAADHDQIVPMSHTQLLVNEFDPEQISFEIIENSDHIYISDHEEYYELIKNFL